jgi:hypothetical protein
LKECGVSKSTIDLPTSGRDLSPDALVTPKWYAAYAQTLASRCR